MALYKYVGEAGRVWPAVPVTPDAGDVVDWRDITPDPLCWVPAKSSKQVRENDNGPYVEPRDPGLPPEDVAPPVDPEVDPQADAPTDPEQVEPQAPVIPADVQE